MVNYWPCIVLLCIRPALQDSLRYDSKQSKPLCIRPTILRTPNIYKVQSLQGGIPGCRPPSWAKGFCQQQVDPQLVNVRCDVAMADGISEIHLSDETAQPKPVTARIKSVTGVSDLDSSEVGKEHLHLHLHTLLMPGYEVIMHCMRNTRNILIANTRRRHEAKSGGCGCRPWFGSDSGKWWVGVWALESNTSHNQYVATIKRQFELAGTPWLRSNSSWEVPTS